VRQQFFSEMTGYFTDTYITDLHVNLRLLFTEAYISSKSMRSGNQMF